LFCKGVIRPLHWADPFKKPVVILSTPTKTKLDVGIACKLIENRCQFSSITDDIRQFVLGDPLPLVKRLLDAKDGEYLSDCSVAGHP
jgi:hypothetical protein